MSFRGFSLVFGPLFPFMRGSDPLGGGMALKRAHLVHGGDIMPFFGHFGDRPPHTTGGGVRGATEPHDLVQNDNNEVFSSL